MIMHKSQKKKKMTIGRNAIRTTISYKKKEYEKKKHEKKEILKGYEFLEHTADVKFLAYGKNLKEAFKNAAKATIAVMTDVKKIKLKTRKKIIIEANTKEALLYDFLEEIIYILDTEGFLMSHVEKLTIDTKNPNYKFVLKAEIVGDFAKNYDVHTYIKAVTYNDMEIHESKNKVKLQVVHDI